LKARLKERLLEVEACVTSAPKPTKPVMHSHWEDSIEKVLRTVRDEGWGIYGPSFPFNLSRYKGLLDSSIKVVDDPNLGPCHTFDITLTEEGRKRAEHDDVLSPAAFERT
jgi:hypothetical protein